MTRHLDLTATLTTTGTVTPPIGPVAPTDTRADLDAAIRDLAAQTSCAPHHRDELVAALRATIEAEVARRLEVAPEVEAAIVGHDDAIYWRGYRHGGGKVPPEWEDVPRDDFTLRAAIAADKARAVAAEATRREAEIFGLRSRLEIVSEIADEAIASASEAPDCHEQVQDYLERMRKWRDDKPVLADPSQRGPLPKGG